MSSTESSTAPRTFTLPGWALWALRLFIMLALPVVLILTSVRLVSSELFLHIEYNRPGFPDDRYGLSKDDRLHYAPYALEYLHNDAGIDYLGDLTFENGGQLYNERELEHMEDVKVVMRAAMRVWLGVGLAFVAVVIGLAWRPATRRHLWGSLAAGGTFTIMLIITAVVLVLANWDYFFDTFHATFFQGGTWQFRNSDTLIRLFPEQFWLDASLTIGFLTIGGALLAVGGALWSQRQKKQQIQSAAAN